MHRFGQPLTCAPSSRSVAMMELLLFMSTLIYRYDFKLVDDTVEELEVVEGFLRKVSFGVAFSCSA